MKLSTYRVHFLPRSQWASQACEKKKALCGCEYSQVATLFLYHVTCYYCKSYKEYKEALYEFEVGFDGNAVDYERKLYDEYFSVLNKGK